MTQKIEIKKYDKTKAKGFFILLKAAELFGVFLFFVGFYGLGNLVNKYFPKFYSIIFLGDSTCVGYVCMWWAGFITFFVIIIALAIAFLLILLLFVIFEGWIKGNWNLAKRFTEDKEAKIKRMKAQDVEEKKQDRKDYGFCVGDEAKYINESLGAANRGRFGQKCKILEIDEDGNIYPGWEDGTKGGAESGCVRSSSFKITKKQKLGGGK